MLYKVWSTGPDGRSHGQPRCEKQRLEEPRGSGEPLYTIWEEYADSQTAWMRDFVPAMEKMLANGYPGGLTPAADHTTGVGWTDIMLCIKALPGGVSLPGPRCLGYLLGLLPDRGWRWWICAGPPLRLDQ